MTLRLALRIDEHQPFAAEAVQILFDHAADEHRGDAGVERVAALQQHLERGGVVSGWPAETAPFGPATVGRSAALWDGRRPENHDRRGQRRDGEGKACVHASKGTPRTTTCGCYDCAAMTLWRAAQRRNVSWWHRDDTPLVDSGIVDGRDHVRTGSGQPRRRAASMATPTAEISNRQLRATLYLPDAQQGFYRSTRFDWSGVIGSLEYKGHQFYSPWFTKTDASVRDFIYKDADIITSAQSSMVGPAEEFSRPQGYTSAKPGGTFVKIGVGVLRKSDDSAYSGYSNYDLVDAGTWTVNRKPDSVEFTQAVTDLSSGTATCIKRRYDSRLENRR